MGGYHIYAHVYTYVYTSICIYICTSNLYAIYTRIYIHAYVHLYTYICISMYIYMRTYLHIYIYISYSYVSACLFTCLHIQGCSCEGPAQEGGLEPFSKVMPRRRGLQIALYAREAFAHEVALAICLHDGQGKDLQVAAVASSFSPST